MEKKRTGQQNKSLHKYCELVATALNEAGLPMQEVLKVDIHWDKRGVKEYMWKFFQQKKYGKSSTTELTTKEIQEVYEDMNLNLGEKLGVHVPWPSLEEQAWSLENLEDVWGI